MIEEIVEAPAIRESTELRIAARTTAFRGTVVLPLTRAVTTQTPPVITVMQFWKVGSPDVSTVPLGLVSDLGWTPEQAATVRAQLEAFEEDWDAPGMDIYDAL